MNIKSSRYFLQLETWIKFCSIGLAAILPPAVIISSWSEGDWSRHVATLALLLSWVELMFLLSRFPNWGYYVLMFGKVASNVVKVSCFIMCGWKIVNCSRYIYSPYGINNKTLHMQLHLGKCNTI